jgi:translation initiation factor 3 subunit E
MSGQTDVEKYDLTGQISPFLDRHMVLPLLDFLQDNKLYDNKDILTAKVALVSQTNMVDYAAEEYENLHGKKQADVDEKRTQLMAELKTKEDRSAKVLKALANVPKDVLTSKFGFDTTQYDISADDVAALYKFAKFSYDCGLYKEAGKYLRSFLQLSRDPETNFQALWGVLAADVLSLDWEAAVQDLYALRDALDQRIKTGHILQVQQRTWLIHWSLFVFFNLDNGKPQMIDFMFQEKTMNAVQTNCPHVLRYITAAVICNQDGHRTLLGDTLRVLKSEKTAYSDPVTNFMLSIFVEFDFEEGRKNLIACEKLLQVDFFLCTLSEEFMNCARRLVFRTYCQTYERIDLSLLAHSLDIKTDLIGGKIVEYIRDSSVNAKIDSNSNQLVMSPKSTSVYQNVLDKTRSISKRTAQLMNSVQNELDKQ